MANESSRTGRVFIGPAGWSYRDWEGIVYPPSAAGDRLLYIARFCNCIELNSSFYRVPSTVLVRGWADRLAGIDDFVLNVKVLGRFTHDRVSDDSGLKDFIERFDPLLEAGKLGNFLLQFPWSFRFNDENSAYLAHLASFFRGRDVAAEVRHGSWDCVGARQVFIDNALTFCNIDQPVIGESMPPSSLATGTGSGYIRLHGRNHTDWFRKGAGRDARYDYLYGKGELEEWKERAASLLTRVNRLFIITNNHFRGQALVNAFQLRSMLTGTKVAVPPALRRAYPSLEEYSLEVTDDGELF